MRPGHRRFWAALTQNSHGPRVAWIALMIRFEKVTKIYKGEVAALRDVTLDVGKGEFVFLVGPVGFGEVDVPPPAAARGGADARAASSSPAATSPSSRNWKVPQLRRNIGCIFQDYKLLPNKTVYENVAFASEVIGRPRHVTKAQVPQILDLVGLSQEGRQLPRRALRW